MAFKTLRESFTAAGASEEQLKDMTKVLDFEEYFRDVIHPTLEMEGYEHLMTGAEISDDRKQIRKLILRFGNDTGYPMDLIVYIEGGLPGLK